MKFTREQKMLIAALEIEFDTEWIPVSNSEQTLLVDFGGKQPYYQILFSLRFYNDKVTFYYKSQQYLVNSIETADSVIRYIEEFKKEFSEMEEHVNIFLNMSYEQLLDYVKNNIEKIIDRLEIGSKND